MGVESEAAAVYWSRLRAILPEELNFQRRIRRGAGDSVNACINYGYGILYTKVFSKITRARLDPYVGFFHTIRSGKTSLLFDTIEMFRQYFVDRPVISWLNKKGKPEFDSSGKLQRKTRSRIAKLVLDRHNSRVHYKGKMEVAENIMQTKIRELAKAMKNEITFSALTWPW